MLRQLRCRGPSPIPMQKSELKCAGDRVDFSLMVATLTPPVVESVTELFVLPLIARGGGFLACIPYGVLDESFVADGSGLELAPSWLGMGSLFDVPLTEEGDDGAMVPLGISGPVLVIDVSDEFLNFARIFDPVTDSDIEIVPYHPDNTSCIPQIDVLLKRVKEWLRERTDQMAAFYSALEDPEVAVKAKAGQRKSTAAPKRVTNAVLMEQLSALTTQIQVLSARQDLLEGSQSHSAAAGISKPAEAVGGRGGGNINKLPDLSAGLDFVEGPSLSVAKALQVVGPPPRTRMGQTTSPSSKHVKHQSPEEPDALLVGSSGNAAQDPEAIINALSQQSTALTALVAHMTQQGGDPMLDLQSGFMSSSSMKGVQRREKLQAELAARSGNFFLLMMQQVHKKLHPGRALPRSEQELGSVSMVEYLEKSGGYKNQKTLGLIQWILAHAIDAAAQEDFAGMKEIVALLAMSVEQANYDNGDWAVAYLVSLHEDPPIQLFQERSVQVSTTSRPFSPLIPPAWTATTLSYIKDLEVLANKKPDLSKRTGQQQQKEQISETPQSGSPRRKPRYPKRPKAAAEGAQ